LKLTNYEFIRIYEWGNRCPSGFIKHKEAKGSEIRIGIGALLVDGARRDLLGVSGGMCHVRANRDAASGNMGSVCMALGTVSVNLGGVSIDLGTVSVNLDGVSIGSG
jgi:hypothetical protein